MPNRSTHTGVGAVMGLLAGLAEEQAWRWPTDRIAFVSGSVAGGAGGGRMPDLLDPACSPNHRGLAHGVIPIGIAFKLLFRGVRSTVDWLLAQADGELDPLKRFALFFSAGFVKGFGPGYLSHLALDFCTPRCLPLFGRLDD